MQTIRKVNNKRKSSLCGNEAKFWLTLLQQQQTRLIVNPDIQQLTDLLTIKPHCIFTGRTLTTREQQILNNITNKQQTHNNNTHLLASLCMLDSEVC